MRLLDATVEVPAFKYVYIAAFNRVMQCPYFSFLSTVIFDWNFLYLIPYLIISKNKSELIVIFG